MVLQPTCKVSAKAASTNGSAINSLAPRDQVIEGLGLLPRICHGPPALWQALGFCPAISRSQSVAPSCLQEEQHGRARQRAPAAGHPLVSNPPYLN